MYSKTTKVTGLSRIRSDLQKSFDFSTKLAVDPSSFGTKITGITSQAALPRLNNDEGNSLFDQKKAFYKNPLNLSEKK